MNLYIFSRTLLFMGVLFSTAFSVYAQERFNRIEFFGGFSHNRVDAQITLDETDVAGRRLASNGLNTSVNANVTKYVGLKFDFAHHRKTDDWQYFERTYRERYSNNSFMGGIQIKNNSKDGPRLKPFAHFLAGVSRQKIAFLENDDEEILIEIKQNNFTFALGGGLDVRLSKRVDLRVFQVDYNPTRIRDEQYDETPLAGNWQNNFRFGVGVVIH